MQPLVATVCDVRDYDGYRMHGVRENYLSAALDVAGVLPLLVPALGGRIDVPGLLSRVDGVLLGGSKTNVHPDRYGVAPSARHAPYDRDRDATSLPVARAAVDAGVPLLAICRGIQELNVALGGTLETEIQEREGSDDHRDDESGSWDDRFALAHPVMPEAGTRLASIVGAAPLSVNSLHRQAIDRLSPRLVVEALAGDGTIEAVSVIDAAGFAVGVQWHPEYWATTDPPSRRLFEAFGAAVRAHAGTPQRGAAQRAP